MKVTGIVRRVDDLGRVVIPKEIRRSMGIREGEPMEIYLENDAVMFRRYSYNLIAEVARVAELVEQYCNANEDTMDRLGELFNEIDNILRAEEECED